MTLLLLLVHSRAFSRYPLGRRLQKFNASPTDSVRFGGYGIIRTAHDPSGSRPGIGWHAGGAVTHHGSLHFTVGVEGGSTVNSTVDQPFSSVESGLSALMFRRDYRDWFLRRGGSVFGSIQVARDFSLSGAFEIARQTTLLAVDALSLSGTTGSAALVEFGS